MFESVEEFQQWVKTPEKKKTPLFAGTGGKAAAGPPFADVTALRTWAEEPEPVATLVGRPGAKKKPEELRGVLAETASALGAGLASTAEAIGATAEMIGIPGGKTAREEWQRIGQSDALRRPDYLQEGTVWEKPERLADWRWWARSFGENLPNTVSMMLPGIAAVRGAQALGWGLKAIRAAGLAGSWSGSMTLEAGSAYGQAKDEMTKAGVLDADSVERIATLEGITAGTVNSLIEMLPFENLFLRQAGADRFLKRIVRQTLWEGGTEAGQEAVNIFVEKLGHKPDQNLLDNIGRILESGIIGGMMGGAMGGTLGTHEHRRNVKHYNALGEQLGVNELVYSLKDAGTPDREIVAQLDARIKELRGETDAAEEKAPPVSYALAGGAEVKDVAQKPVIPEVDAQEMVSYLLYGEGKYTPPAGIFGRATNRAKKGVLGVFGMKETVAAPAEEKTAAPGTTRAETLMPGSQAGKDVAQTEPLQQAKDREKKAEARKKGETLFDNVIGELTQEDQQRLEATRQQELLLKDQEEKQAAIDTETQAQIAIAQASTEQDTLTRELAAGDPKKQALVAEVMGLSDRVVLSSVQQELGLNVQPAGQDRYEIVTEKGAAPVPVFSLRKLLAEKRIGDFAAVEKKRQEDLAAVQRRTEEARIKKEKEIADWAFSNAREALGYGRTLSQEQLAHLEASRDQLTPEEIARLDAGPAVAKPFTPPRSLQAMGVRGRPTAIVPARPEPVLQAAGEVGRSPAEEAADETKVREYVLDDLAYQLKDIGPTGWVGNEEGGGRRLAAGGAISRTVKIFGNQSTTPLRDEKRQPVTLHLSKAYLANVIDKARTGKPLTEQQQAVHDVIIREAKDETHSAWRMISEEAEASSVEFNPHEFANEGQEEPAAAKGEETAAGTKEETAPKAIIQPGANSEIAAAANEAAPSPENNIPEPTAAQQEAGNFKMGHVNYQGLEISIEHPAGSTRKGVDKKGNEWERTLASHYGYIKKTEGKDGEHIDVFIPPDVDPESDKVFVVDQKDDSTGKFDEHKVMLGFDSKEKARQGYLSNYDESGPNRIMDITEMTVDDFKAWLKDGDQKKPAAAWNPEKVPQAEKPPAVEVSKRTPSQGVAIATGQKTPKTAPVKFQIGDIVRPKTGSGIGAYATGRIQHILYYQDGGEGIKTENTGNMHFKAEDWELVEPEKSSAKAGPKTGDLLSSDEFDALAGDVLAEMEKPATKAAAEPPTRTATSQGVTAAVGKPAAPAKKAPAAEKIAETLPDLTVTGQPKPVPGHPEAGYVVHHRKPDLIPDTFKVVFSRVTTPPLFTLAGTGMDPAAAYRSALAQYEQKLAKERVAKPTPKKVAGAEFQQGDRVIFKTNGRHGKVDKVSAITMRALFMGAGRDSETTTYSYTFLSDSGAEFFASAEQLSREEGAPPAAVPDIRIDGHFYDPEHALRRIRYAKESVRKHEAAAQRARKRENIQEHQRDAQRERANAAEEQKIFDDWAAKYPEEAQKARIADVGPAPSQGVAIATGQRPAGIPAVGTATAAGASSLEALGLTVTKSTTNTGKTVWNVSGNTREHMDAIKKAGGRWYGPKKVWSFYNSDPTPALQEALGIRAGAAAAPRGEKTTAFAEATYIGQNADGMEIWQRNRDGARYAIDNGIEVWVPANKDQFKTVEELKTAQFVKGDKVIVQHGDKTYPATVLQGGLGSSSVSPDLTMKQAADLGLGAVMRVDNDRIRPAASLGKAASEVAAGVASSYDAIAEILKKAGKGPISMMAGGVFDEELYQAIKPHLQATYDHFRAAAIEVKEWMKETISQFAARGFDSQAIIPYIKRFYMEVTKNDLTKGETGITLESQEGGDRHGTAVDTTRPGEGEAANDRAGAQGPGAAVLPGIEGGRETGGVPEGSRTGHDGELRPGGRGTPVEGARAGRPSGLPGEGAAVEHGREPGVGGNARDLAGVQRPAKPRDHRIDPGDLIRTGSWLATAKTNIDIIALVKDLERENRPATPDEQRFIARYTGFGAGEIRNKLFEGYANSGELMPNYVDAAWRPLVESIQGLLTPEEIRTMARSTQYAHYTSGPVIGGIYRALERLGFTGGKILEPGMGIGHFWGLMPEAMRGGSRYTGVEMDHLTAQIAQVLYPEQNVLETDFTKQAFPNDFFDIAVGNPPFSKTQVLADPDYKKYRLSLHNYFFVKTLDKIRPGGILAFVTSHYTMDSENAKARERMAERADLIGAIRLPDTAFKANAGTEVVTDILFFRKRAEGEKPAGENWINRSRIEIPGSDTYPAGVEDINEYFANHPEMVLGTHSLAGKMYRELSYTVKPSGNLEAQLEAAANRLPQNIYSTAELPAAEQQELVVERDFNPANRKEGGLYVDSERRLMRTKDGAGVPFRSLYPKFTTQEIDWLKDYCRLRDTLKQAQYDQLKDGPWEDSLQAIREAYDRFVFSHGKINDFTLRERTETTEEGEKVVVTQRVYRRAKILRMDVESPLISALETITEEGKILPGPFLRDRTIRPRVIPEVRGAADALAVTLDETGKLDLDKIAEKSGLSREEAISQLGDLIYDVPGTGQTLADEYLSGDVVKKLEEAQAAAAADPKYRRNVDALRKVQPQPLAARDVTVTLGGNWIPLEHYDAFAEEVLGLDGIEVNYRAADNNWSVAIVTEHRRRSWGPSRQRISGRQSLRGSASEWGTGDRGANELLDSALNSRVVRITRRLRDGSTQHDAAASQACNDIIKRMKERFSAWVWEDAARASEVINIYNRKFNNLAGRRFDGTHMTLPGLSLLYKLHDHQRRAIWRVVQTGNAYLAHAVGAGKTLEMVCGGMEMKRLGQIRKPLYIVPNHMLQQFSSDFQAAYPLAHIMIADEENFGKENRRNFVAQATLNNPDAIVLTHSAFGLLKVSPETVAPVRDALIAQLRETLEELQADRASRARISKIEQQIEQVEQRFDALTYSGNRDDVVNFEEMGVDYLFVDEAHLFRKLDFDTNRQVKGIDPAGSTRAMDLYIKTRWLESQNPRRSHSFASGTPITNTIAELYTLMRFFIEPELQRNDLGHFDAWANLYGATRVTPEMNAAGRYDQVERFAEFVNIPELMSRVRTFMDILTPSQLGGVVDLPAIRGGKAEIVITPPSEGLKDYQRTLEARIRQSRDWRPSKEEPGNPDPLINIITDGRLASIDLRYVRPNSPNDPRSKLNGFLDGIIASWKETKDNEYADPATGKVEPIKGGSIVSFYNHGFGASVMENRGFDARGWAMQRFREAGIPTHEVGWIDDADKAQKKADLFKAVRQGKKRILIGSAKKMGTGMNVQKRLAALHYLDPPWYPADVEQPDGRIVRQGNLNKEVVLQRYATKGSYDATMWQMVARKSRFTEQAFLGDPSIRKLQDLSEASQYEMAAALASGDERVIHLANLRADRERLQNLQWSHVQEQSRLHGILSEREAAAAYKAGRLKLLAAANEKNPGYIRTIEGRIGGQPFDDRDDFGRALLDAYNRTAPPKDRIVKGTEEKKIAEMDGFDLLRKNAAVYNALVLRLTTGIDIELETQNNLDPEKVSPLGLVTRIVNQINGISTDIRTLENSLEEDKKEAAQAKKRIGAPFAYERELVEKIAEIAQLEHELVEEGRAAEAAARAGQDPNDPHAGQHAAPPNPVDQDLAALHPADGGPETAETTGTENPLDNEGGSRVQENREGYYEGITDKGTYPTTQERNGSGTVPEGTGGIIYPEIASAVAWRGRVPTRTVRTNHDAAKVTRSLIGNQAQEKVLSILLDKNDKIIQIYQHTIGLKAESQVDPTLIAGQALNTPGVTSLYLAHNHPSGEARLSLDDAKIHDGLENLLKGTAVELKESLAVTPERYSTRSDLISGRTPYLKPDEEGKNAVRVPVVERIITRQGKNLPHFTGSGEVYDYLQDQMPGGGLLLLGNQNQPVGKVAITDYQKLRGEQQRAILSELEKTNANRLIAYTANRAMTSEETANLLRFVEATGGRVLLMDIIDDVTGSWRANGTITVDDHGNVSYPQYNRGDRVFYALGEDEPGLSLSLGDKEIGTLVRELAQTVKGIEIVGQDSPDGPFMIRAKSGDTVFIEAVDRIDVDKIQLKLGYGDGTGNIEAAGAYQSYNVGAGQAGFISLVRGKAGAWTINHEFYHFLEDIGAISNEDKNLLNRKIRSLVAKDPAAYAKIKGISPAEQRAEWAGRTLAGAYDATTPTGKIIQKIKDVIDQILNALGIRTAGGVVRDIRAGRIQDRIGIPGTRRAAAQNYAVGEKEKVSTETPAFKKWFGESKVVDQDGTPRKMYHGTNQVIETFDKGTVGSNFGADREGFFFTNDPALASDFASGDDSVAGGTEPQEGANVMPVYLRIQKPYTLEDFESRSRINVFNQMEENMDSLGDFYDTYKKRILKGAKEVGADGILFEYGHEVLAVAFEPTQIKSATGNRGTFNEKDPRIQYVLADEAERAAASVTGAAARAGSRGLAMMGARTSPAVREAAGAFAKHWKEFWQPFSTVPDGDKILAKRYEAMGNVARAVRFIDELFQKVNAYPDQVKKDMFWFLNGDIPLETLPAEVRETAQMIQRRTEVIGEMLVERGIIAEGQFEKYRGKYIHYMYAKHVMGEDKPIFLTSTGKLNLSYTKSRNTKLTMQQKKELGLIEDASVAVPVGMGKALTDIAKWDYLQAISENADWVWQPSLIKVPIGRPLAEPIRGRTRRNVTMGIGKLIEETKTYDAMLAKHPTPEVAEIHRILHEALDRAEAASENMPADFVQLPNSKGYGPLAGAYIRKPIADDLMPVLDVATDRGKLMNAILEIERQGMATFKMGKVALNIPTAVRNIVSNIIQNNMRGRSLAKIPGDIIRACESMLAKNEYYEEAFGMGLFHTNWFVSEINNVLDEFRKVKGGRIDQILIAVKNVAKYYGKIDDISKLAIFIEQREAGKPVDEATLEAMKWGMDYSLTSRSIKGLRQTIVPFATYQYKIAPLIAESLKKRPWVLAKYGLIYTAAKMIAMGFNDLDDDDWEDLEKQLPAYIKKSGSMMILPWKSNKGQWQWVNLEYFFPWGNYLGIARDMKAADLGEGLRDAGISNPFLSMLYTGLSAREDQPPLHSYFGTPIYNQLDPAPMKAAKLLEYMANIWIPSMATRQGAIGYTGRAIAGGEDRWGREVSAGQALGRWFGVNIVSVSPEQTRAQASVRIQDLRKEQSRIDANPSYDDEEKAAYAGRLNEKLADIAQEAPAAVLPITKAKGKDPVYDALQAMAAKGILHTAPPSRSVEIAGTPFKMTMEQYGRYLEETSSIARARLLPLINSPAWEAMNDKRKSDAVSRIVAHARKGIRQRIKIDIAQANREKIRTVQK